MSGLCLLAAGLSVALGTSEITLSWLHSIEKIEWRETWVSSSSRLQLTRVSIKGSGAGMEPDPSAVLEHGRYVWSPKARFEEALTLRRSGMVADWRLCRNEGEACKVIGDYFKGEPDPVTLLPCAALFPQATSTAPKPP